MRLLLGFLASVIYCNLLENTFVCIIPDKFKYIFVYKPHLAKYRNLLEVCSEKFQFYDLIFKRNFFHLCSYLCFSELGILGDVPTSILFTGFLHADCFSQCRPEHDSRAITSAPALQVLNIPLE